MTRQSFVIVPILSVLFLSGCSRTTSDGGGGFTGCGGSVSYDGPDATPICGSEAYGNACRAWQSNTIPYCYAPAGHGDVGPAPFPSCVVLIGGGAPEVARDENGWASWWCCPFHGDGDGGTVVLDGGGFGGAAGQKAP